LTGCDSLSQKLVYSSAAHSIVSTFSSQKEYTLLGGESCFLC